MRTTMLLGLAAGTLLLTANASAEQPALDYGVPADPDARVYTGYPDRVPSEVEYRRVSGYDAEGRWTGTWDGTYETPDGRRYEGRYEGTIEGHGPDYPPPPAYDPYYHGGYDARYNEEMERRCGRGGTVGGAVVGGLVGGIAGNRIAGRGDRTAGTLIGAGVGALAGSAIGNAADKKKCEDYWSSRSARYDGYYQGGTYPGGYSTTYQYGGYGYGYYTPGVVVTTIISGAPVVTERVETSTRTYYENVPVRKRYVAKKKWRPKPKAAPRCVC
ncbi:MULTISPECIES: glycine zipper domain-containing protein [unclassified Sphingopyxis]|uniref:glycine zipper domain-containing protein n=1 Tax=unclassified Sphingopyxis TaxID=2614943 RepID=UPI00078397C1|nr:MULTISPECIES: glycine zipper domain-containing protein [unclassified Sphingopyxis]USI76162.1 glycine zipper 2TM domain-containing protein [Sphingopyxis sp. USTB-05]